ncbi:MULTISPECIES: pyrimidine 5'-nucleotidase [Euryhalocaulis]|uniref:pyrimidine 5'-nucleotidase n=1 Tax=Euryhalocaulis TaxID=1712422 RepID=UPI00039FE8BD|nr:MULTISPECIES: pyrimidine 5'-nucleotidase [Euryhalocaulis]MBA4801644.1 pyrimidine 5'-nucleotidase [Euryhalocaulis sp.]
MSAPDFSHVEAWVFDLDNTLYPSECDLFAQIDVRMRDWVADFLKVSPDEARIIQKRYYADHGTTLKGLMAVHGADPGPYLDYVHEIELDVLEHDALLAERIAALPGARVVFTNGSVRHAERVLEKRGLADLFDAIFDIQAAGFEPKPARIAFDRMAKATGVAPRRAAMFEDLARNLEPAAELGFTTVLVTTGKDWSHEPEGARPAAAGEAPDFVDHVTDDLTAFLGDLKVRKAA